jgi:hypothetical protein
MNQYSTFFVRAFAAIAFCSALNPASAQTTVGAHLVTGHTSPGFNDSNPGMYFRLDNGFTAGSYFNSERRQSNYMGITVPVFDGAFDVSVLAMTGYRKDAALAVVPSKSFALGSGYSVRLTLLAPPKSTAAMHFSFERQW